MRSKCAFWDFSLTLSAKETRWLLYFGMDVVGCKSRRGRR